MRKNIPHALEIRETAIADYASGMSSRYVAQKYNIHCHKTVLRWVKYLGLQRTREEADYLQSIHLKGIRRNPATEFHKGIIPWNKGRICIEQSGPNHHNWRGGQSPYPPGWQKSLRESIRDRDNRTCQICGCLETQCKTRLEVHHIDYNKNNLDQSNLISLCKKCHTKTGFHREKWIDYFKRIKNMGV
jgi:hypothetical protein